jgi:hypothetical protein
MSNNVISFPRENKNPQTQKTKSIEEINHNLEQMNLYHIQESVVNIIPIIFTQLEIGGFNVEDLDEDVVIKEGAFLVEALRSIMCRHYGIYHPFQKLSEEIFEYSGDKDEALKIVDELTIVLKEDEE